MRMNSSARVARRMDPARDRKEFAMLGSKSGPSQRARRHVAYISALRRIPLPALVDDDIYEGPGFPLWVRLLAHIADFLGKDCDWPMEC